MAHGRTEAKGVTLFIKRPAEVGRNIQVPKSRHPGVVLFHCSMILLDPIVQVAITAMHDLYAERFADRARIQVVAISR